jgi:uncharacterized protein (DUF849 family)
MAAARKVIVTCAITGSGHTPTMSPHLPVTPDQIVEESLAAAEAGAAVVHLHARDPRDGRPTPDASIFLEYVRRIKQASDVVISLSSGGGTGMSVEQRLAGVLAARPELCTLNMGSMNYGGFPMIDRYKGRFEHDWEEPYLASTRTEPFLSTYADIEHMLTVIGPETGARFEFEAYDIGHLYTLAYFLDRGLVKPPIFLQTIFGTMGGIGPEVDHIAHMKRTADRLLGDNYHWSVLGAGANQMRVAAQAAAMGGNVRVGMEDSLWIGPGKLAQSNAQQVTNVRKILEGLGLEIASPDEAREILSLKGGDKVGF